MEPFIIKSTHDSSELRLGPPNPIKGAGVQYLAQLRGPVVNASVEVFDLEASHLVSYFLSLANDWRGWTGKKKWGSREGQLQLECHSNSLGHIFMRIRIRDDFGGPDWLAEGTLFLEAGQLDDLANTCKRVFGKGLAV